MNLVLLYIFTDEKIKSQRVEKLAHDLFQAVWIQNPYFPPLWQSSTEKNILV